MKLRKEYLDTRICFMNKDWVVRFIDERLYPKMLVGFSHMFCFCGTCKDCSCDCHTKPLENKKKDK